MLLPVKDYYNYNYNYNLPVDSSDQQQNNYSSSKLNAMSDP
jgi:hypothetical protein